MFFQTSLLPSVMVSWSGPAAAKLPWYSHLQASHLIFSSWNAVVSLYRTWPPSWCFICSEDMTPEVLVFDHLISVEHQSGLCVLNLHLETLFHTWEFQILFLCVILAFWGGNKCEGPHSLGIDFSFSYQMYYEFASSVFILYWSHLNLAIVTGESKNMDVYVSELWIWLNCAVQNSRMEEEKEFMKEVPARRRGPSQRCFVQDQERCTCPQQPCVSAFYQVSAFIPAAATLTAAQTVKVVWVRHHTVHTHTQTH